MSDNPRHERRRRFALNALAVMLLGLAAATHAAAAAPTQFPFEETFVGVNPCTGLDDTIHVTGTFYVFERGNGISHRLDRTVTTSSGFSGHGIEVSVDHDRIFTIHDMLTNEAGEHIRAQLVLVQDAAGRLRVDRFEVTCG